MADQSKLENFVGSDQLEVVSATATPSYSVLSFSHRVAKLVCSLTVENGTAEGAIVRLFKLEASAGRYFCDCYFRLEGIDGATNYSPQGRILWK